MGDANGAAVAGETSATEKTGETERGDNWVSQSVLVVDLLPAPGMLWRAHAAVGVFRQTRAPF